MAKPKLRILFNVLLSLMLAGFLATLYFTEDVSVILVITYFILYTVVTILREKIAPKKKRSDNNGNN